MAKGGKNFCWRLLIVLCYFTYAQSDDKTNEMEEITDHAVMTEKQLATPSASNIARDETVQFFPTAGVFDEATKLWRIPVHGWVYEPQDSQFRRAIFVQALKSKYNLQITEQNQGYLDYRLHLMIADNERNKTINLLLAGQEFTLPKSSANGHFLTELSISDELISQHSQHSQHNSLDFVAVAKDGRRFEGEVQLLAAEGVSVISDIDDTIKVSNVLTHQALIENTFLKPFFAVPGMSEAYQDLANRHEGMSFHYVSSSPWQLYAPLQEFVDDNHFPAATFSLKAIRFRDSTLFDLFKPGTETKPKQIEAILAQFPKREFILIGDSGEQDPEVYSAMLNQYPDRIIHVFIRNITNESINNARMSALVDNPAKWTLFADPSDIAF